MAEVEFFVLVLGRVDEQAIVLGPFASEDEARPHATAPDAKIVQTTKIHPPQPRASSPSTAAAPPSTWPWGKFKGTPIEDLPTHYIEWALENMERLSPALREELEAQLAMRGGHGVVRHEGRR